MTSELKSDTRKLTACFFARVGDPRQIETVEFYAQDVAFLTELGFEVRVVTRIRDLLRRPNDDVYFCWWWTWAFAPVAIARAARKPAVVTGTFNYNVFFDRPRHQRTLIAWAARHANANVFVSRHERDAVTSMLPVTRPSVSPHTVDTALYAPAQAGEARERDVLLSVVHMAAGNSIRKCVPESIRALAILAKKRPAARLVIAGERGSDYPALAQLAEKSGVADRVIFPGSVSRKEKIRLMQRCSIYLQPSRFEGFGLAGLEAMACGAPVITSPVGAVTEVGGDVVSYVDGSVPEQIAESAERLLSDDARREEMGKAARKRAVEQFSPRRRLTDLREVLREIGVRC